MGEEEKKPAEEKKPEEAKKAAAEEDKKEAAAKAEKPAEDGKKRRRRVEDVITDCRASKVVVKGEKADPLKVLERVQRKSHRQVELISPIPKPPPEEKPEEKEVVKPEEKKEEPPVITVVLGVYMHCEACAQEIKRRIQRMKGVESAEPDLKSSQVTVKGVLEPEKLAEYVYKRTGKHAAIIKVEPEKKEEKGKEEEKKADEGEKEAAKKGEEEPAKENKEGGGGDAGGGSGGEAPAKAEAEAEDPKLEMRKNEFYYYYPQNYYQLYPPRFIQEMNQMNPYPPQIFSDENPNACSVM
ncbi:UNVERIFIED_CONTAM: Heavy metal-associated isoprenylated plant protein 7 [Sesamum latifolium]|uniref:Heavy metal-associated isoprenylated plant protein 7 n=1 Tax=Sesamum latifolium TaxID=2727402 RepID=A0AAW2UES2_9LAMI